MPILLLLRLLLLRLLLLLLPPIYAFLYLYMPIYTLERILNIIPGSLGGRQTDRFLIR